LRLHFIPLHCEAVFCTSSHDVVMEKADDICSSY
jgi:hypothetical protein